MGLRRHSAATTAPRRGRARARPGRGPRAARRGADRWPPSRRRAARRRAPRSSTRSGLARGQAGAAGRGRRRPARRPRRDASRSPSFEARSTTRVRLDRGRALRPEAHRVRRRAGRGGRARGDDARCAPIPPRTAATCARRATSTSVGARPGRRRAARGGGGGRAARRARLPARPHDADPRRRAARAPDARVGGPRRGARPRARPRGLLRGHELRAGRTPRARCGSAPR